MILIFEPTGLNLNLSGASVVATGVALVAATVYKPVFRGRRR